jgi:hypothetical protein
MIVAINCHVRWEIASAISVGLEIDQTAHTTAASNPTDTAKRVNIVMNANAATAPLRKPKPVYHVAIGDPRSFHCARSDASKRASSSAGPQLASGTEQGTIM